MSDKTPPFFSYFGSKNTISSKYPPPKHDVIIEPLAGAAGYSTLHWEKNIILIDKYFRIARLWKYLISATEKDILNLPLVERDQNIRDIEYLSDEERDLIGFWINRGTEKPKNYLSPRAIETNNKGQCGSWSELTRKRLAKNIYKTDHWKVYLGDYSIADPPFKATWLIDPPYKKMGYCYVCPLLDSDYKKLAEWCKTREGQVIVCENESADWLPFTYLCNTEGSRCRTKELVWINE
jgi:hypothetical protein